MSNQVPPQPLRHNCDRRIAKLIILLTYIKTQNTYLGLKIEELENQIEYLNAWQTCHGWLIICLITSLITVILYLIFNPHFFHITI